MEQDGAVSEAIRRVRKAAIEGPLKVCCDLVVDEAKRLTGAENGRLRFVDYTGKRLVPGAIRGALGEKAELAVREFECIVGRCAKEKLPQKVDDVEFDRDFIAFKSVVLKRADEAASQGRGRVAADLRDYHDNTLAKLGSEIAIPVSDGTDLLGVLSVNAFEKNAFGGEHVTMLSDFAREVAVALVKRRASLLEDLHQIEAGMASVFELTAVAQHIADGIRKAVEGSIPNIFLYDESHEQKNGTPFQFLVSAGATQEEKDLGAFSPRAKGLGAKAIDNHAKGKDPFVVEEYVDDKSSRGSTTARVKGVRSTGCLPLVFRGRIVGVVYLHFKERHYFTADEKRMLDVFATHAAITIRNASTMPSYAKLYGSKLIEQLASLAGERGSVGMCDYQHKLEGVQKELKNTAERLSLARGEEEISECILDGVARLCKEECFNVTPRMPEIFRRFRQHEGILYALPYYRDHFTHAFHVFSLGYLILKQWFTKQWFTELAFLQANDLGRRYSLLKQWFIASILHDIAYPIEMAESWIPRFPSDVLGVDVVLRSTFDWSQALSVGRNVVHFEMLADRFVDQLPEDLGEEKLTRQGLAFKEWFAQQLLESHDHGALGAISLPNLEWSSGDEDCAYGAALDIVLHNYHKKKHATLGKLALSSHPLSALLAYCDTAQEWGRPQTGGVAGRPGAPIKTVKFESALVESARTTVTLLYDIGGLCEKTCRGWSKLNLGSQSEKRDKQERDVSNDLQTQIKALSETWRAGAVSHSLLIRACDENRKEIDVVAFLV